MEYNKLIKRVLSILCAVSVFTTPAMAKEDGRQDYEDGWVRVSIVMQGDGAIERYAVEGIARNQEAMDYRQQVIQRQNDLSHKIEQEALDGERLDICWNLALAGNVIAANVKESDIDKIRKVPGVQEVARERRYRVPEVDEASEAEPMSETSGWMSGIGEAWGNDYRGDGSIIAVIDTGINYLHKSFSEEAWMYSLGLSAKDAGMGYEEYIASLDLLDSKKIAAVLDQTNAYQKDKGRGAEKFFFTKKIPFGFNYIDNDLDITHVNDNESSHGSHVAGIAGANLYVRNGDGYQNALDSVRAVGMAPNAQLLAMKVFGKNGGAYDSDYMAAIEDAIILGADAINLSLGSVEEGFALENGYIYQDMLDSLADTGVVVTIACGNEYSFAYHDSNAGMLYVEDVSNNRVGSPGSYANSLAVASVDNDGTAGYYFTVDDTPVFYSEPSASKKLLREELAGEQAYVMLTENYGTEQEALNLEPLITGKIVLVPKGGSIGYGAKANNLVKHGALAVGVCVSGIGTGSFSGYEYDNPVFVINSTQAKTMASLGREYVSKDGYAYRYGTMKIATVKGAQASVDKDHKSLSSFSSHGVPGNLTLKPEVAAPGGSIRSVNGMNDTGYELKSGTSMATPHVAGFAAVMAQYIRENEYARKEGIGVRQLSQSLLMSTARPQFTKENEYWSLMKQGAGLVDMARAVNAKGYILMDEGATESAQDGKVKVEWGDDPQRNGVYSFGFTLHNMGDVPLSYVLDTRMFTQAVETRSGRSQAYQNGTYLSQKTQRITANASYRIDGVEYDPSHFADLDVDRDGDCDNDDADAILSYVAGNASSDKIDESVADVDKDGDIDTYDAHLLLERIGSNAFTVEASGSVHVQVDIALSKETKELFEKMYPSGAYIEGYAYVNPVQDDNGTGDVTHSIPLLGFYGNWSDASMYDRATYIEYLAAGKDYSKLEKMPYTVSTMRNKGNEWLCNALMVNGSYYSINPYASWDDAYEKAALRSNAMIDAWYPRLIRNSGAGAALVFNEKGELVFVGDVSSRQYSIFYYDGAWNEEVDDSLYLYGGFADTVQKTPAQLGFKEGDGFAVSSFHVPEYYAGRTVIDKAFIKSLANSKTIGDGAYMSLSFTVDDTAPVLVASEYKDGTLALKARDNAFLAYVSLRKGDEEIASVVPNGNKGEAASLEFQVAKDTYDAYVCDYAGNEARYAIHEDGEAVLQGVSCLALAGQAEAQEAPSLGQAPSGVLNGVSLGHGYPQPTNMFTVYVDAEQATNARYEISYDKQVVWPLSVETQRSHADYKINDGTIALVFAAKDADNGRVAAISFQYDLAHAGKTTDVIVKVMEENEGQGGTETRETIILGKKRMKISFQSGENGKFIEPKEKEIFVEEGDLVECKVQPDEGFAVDQVVANGQVLKEGKDGVYSFLAKEDTVVKATFRPIECTVVAKALPGGTISPQGEKNYAFGEMATYAVQAEEHYQIDKVLLNGEPVELDADGTFSFIVEGDSVIEASFKLQEYTVETRVEGKGTLSPGEARKAAAFEKITFTVTPDAHWEIGGVYVNGKKASVANGRVTVEILGDTVVKAEFVRKKYKVLMSVHEGGVVTPDGTMEYEALSEAEYAVLPNEGYVVDKVMVNGKEASLQGNVLRFQVDGDASVDVYFAKIMYNVRIVERYGDKDETKEEASYAYQDTVNVNVVESPRTGYVFGKIIVNGKTAKASLGQNAFIAKEDMEIVVAYRMLHIEFYRSQWFEDGMPQGVEGDPKNLWDTQYAHTERGREIYDPATDAWYWLDAIYNGAPAKNKEVWMPYVFQDEIPGSTNGKWVRYDASGRMIKGWYVVSGNQAVVYPQQAGNMYYYDWTTGEMLKGWHVIDGLSYFFDEKTGVFQQ